MKKTALAILFLLFVSNLFAQENGMRGFGFRLGLTAHPNFGFAKAEGGKGDGVALGFVYGVIGDFNFAENYSFSTGLTITTINSKVVELLPSVSSAINAPPIEAKSKYMMQYIEIPLTLKLKTANINGVRWYGQFGLSNDFRISAKLDQEVASVGSVSNIDNKKYTQFYRAGVIIGGGGEFDLSGKTSLLLGLTLNNGFTNVSSNGNKLKNHFVGINFGMFF